MGDVNIRVLDEKAIVLKQGDLEIHLYPHQARQLGKLLKLLADGIEERHDYIPPDTK